MTNLQKLADPQMRWVRDLSQHFIEQHLPHFPTNEPVTMDRKVFDALCLCALVGLDTVEDYLEKQTKEN